jgi:small subunit ribosomal protein S16
MEDANAGSGTPGRASWPECTCERRLGDVRVAGTGEPERLGPTGAATTVVKDAELASGRPTLAQLAVGLRLLVPSHRQDLRPLPRSPRRPHLTAAPSPVRILTGVTSNVAVKIRLKRLGKIRSPHYRIVVADARTKRDGRSIEEIGKYHPKNDPSVIEVNSERAQYWLSVGAQPTEAVIALLKRTGDWQKFSGDTSPSGVDPQPLKGNKTDAFNAALADAGSERRASATPTRRSRQTTVEGTAGEAQAAADAGVADAAPGPEEA